jgi:uncharacterized protein with NRDE domain
MCLLIAKPTLEGLLLGFNRDDNILRTHNKIEDTDKYTYPIDKQAKGTWIGLNKQNNNVYALLNHNGTRPKNPQTRGEIIPNLLNNENHKILFQKYSPFQLFQYNHKNKKIQITFWDGKTVKNFIPKQNDLIILTSSSYGVEIQRKLIAQKLLEKTTTLNKSNLRQILENNTYFPSTISPKMKGKNSETISTSILEITNQHTHFNYE